MLKSLKDTIKNSSRPVASRFLPDEYAVETPNFLKIYSTFVLRVNEKMIMNHDQLFYSIYY